MSTETALEFRRVLAARPEHVYRAWTEAEGLKQWLAPGDVRVAEATADARPGGRWSVLMEDPEGQRFAVAGEYVELHPPSRVVMTWRWGHEPEEATSRITVTLRAVEGGTELHMVHDGLSPESRDPHGDGWEKCLAKLGAVLG